MKRKDVYLPGWLCGFGILLLAVCCSCIEIMDNMFQRWLLAILCLLFGIAALLCWRNQWIEMTSSFEFVYSTMFGRQTTYRFSELKGYRCNRDDITLFLDRGKVHIEACAVISQRFATRVNKELGQPIFIQKRGAWRMNRAIGSINPVYKKDSF